MIPANPQVATSSAVTQQASGSCFHALDNDEAKIAVEEPVMEAKNQGSEIKQKGEEAIKAGMVSNGSGKSIGEERGTDKGKKSHKTEKERGKKEKSEAKKKGSSRTNDTNNELKPPSFSKT
ncbi:unnamed protein product [Linum trigynum]|uniref:Uncharacterized protein n=1 Tax=Linum trigynum TaxID=586398 RepID=A0AAV2DTC0_9ROSI